MNPNAVAIARIESQYSHAQVICLTTYAKLLRTCGVRQINVFSVPAEKL